MASEAELKKRLKELQDEAKRARHLANKRGASLEALMQARKRTNAIITRLKKDGTSPAEEKMVPEFRDAARDLTKRIGTARAARKKQEGILRRTKVRIKAVRQRLKDKKSHGYNGEMQDSIDVGQFYNPKAVAGYTSGYWPTYPTLERIYPDLPKLSYAVTASHDADALDVEPGDATPAEAAAWVKRQKARGVSKPAVYASVSTMPAVLSALASAGISRSEVRVITAHYNGIYHRCSPTCGFGMNTEADATQYTDHGYGRNLDLNACAGVPWHK